MPYGYLGTTPNQQKANSGVFSVEEALALQNVGELGGSLEHIETKTISGDATAIFTSIKEAKYDVHFLEIIDFQPTTDGSDLRIRFYESGTEESASVYEFAYQYGTASGTFSDVNDSSETYLRATFNTGNTTNEKANSYNYFYNLGNSSKYSFQTMQTVLTDSNTAFNMALGGGVLPQASTVDQIKLYRGAGTFSCTAKLYGVKQI